MNSSNKTTRRGFIRGAVTASVGFPYIIKSSALGKAGSVAPSNRVVLGHIGVGGQGTGLLRNFLQLSGARCAAVCDPNAIRAAGAKARIDDHYGGGSCTAYGDFRRLLARADIDAVVVATPDHWHVPIALAAARAGKDMYVEKPLGVSVEQNKALRDQVASRRLVFQYGTQQRSDRNFRFACELAVNGRLGRVHTIHAWCANGEKGGSAAPEPVPEGLDYEMWLGPAPYRPFSNDRCFGKSGRKGVYHISDYALGFIAGWGAHPLDIAQWGNGTELTAPVEYAGWGEFPDSGLFDTALKWDVDCRYANDVLMRFMSEDVAKPIVSRYRRFHDHGTTFIGEDGWVSVDRKGICAAPEGLLNERICPNDISLYHSDNHYENFIDCVLSRWDTISPIGPAVQSDIISHLSDVAIRTKRKIAWDPAAEKIIGDEQASRMLSRAMRAPWRL